MLYEVITGVYKDSIRKSEISNVADGTQHAWISQVEGEKWLEVDFGEEKEVGCIQFLNGWDDHGGNRNLLSQYSIEYYNGEKWISKVEFDGRCDDDFSEEFHVYGFEWNEKEFKFYFDGELYRTVITSYSIHYTKLYDALSELAMIGCYYRRVSTLRFYRQAFQAYKHKLINVLFRINVRKITPTVQ